MGRPVLGNSGQHEARQWLFEKGQQIGRERGGEQAACAAAIFLLDLGLPVATVAGACRAIIQAARAP